MKNINIILIASLVLFLSACELPFNVGCISPEGNVETRTVSFETFDKVEIKIDAEVFITEGDTQEVVIESQSNVIDRILDDSSVRNDELILEINGCISMANNTVIVRITIPSLSGLKIAADGQFQTVGTFNNVSDLILDIEGDGKMELDLGDNLDLLSLDINGDGDVTCSGSAQEVDIDIDGDGKVFFHDLLGSEVRAQIKGDGELEINATEKLQLQITGDGEIEAIGTAELQQIKIIGDGKIKNFELFSTETDIDVQGDCDIEVRVSDLLNVKLRGDGKVCYKGDAVVEADITGGGKITNCD